MAIPLDGSIQYLKGVGEKRAALYQKLEIQTVRQLLYYFPRSYIDLSHPVPIEDTLRGEVSIISGQVLFKSPEQHIRKGLSVFKVQVCDDSGDLTLIFFNAKYVVDTLKIGSYYYFQGKISGQGFKKEMQSPLAYQPDSSSCFVPIYPLTHGLSSKMIHTNILQALELLDETAADPIPDIIRQKYFLSHLHYALKNIHLPKDEKALEVARNRLIFEEFFFLSLSLSAVKNKRISHTAYNCLLKPLTPFTESLPFTLTGAQEKTIKQVIADMCLSVPMNRLVQGDVGSGKTMVAAAGAYFAFLNGFQTAMMVPTEILARQHYEGLSRLLEPLGMRLAFLSGTLTAKEKRQVKEKLALGMVDLCIGTHALISADVAFSKLALVITDEQHRFGVGQRTKLSEKSDHPHTLVMSATPIPRTLALIVYGDLDVSIIDELPPQRQPVKTYLIDSSKKKRAYHFIQEHLDLGMQAYVVCPLVDATETTDTKLINTEEYAEDLAKGWFYGYTVAVLHGKMKANQKEETMAQFQAGKVQLLVSTTVIEVGVDVPNAVIMLIENADRFGLSQLHQLRGRVGRGSVQSHCILVSDTRNEETRRRLNVMQQTNDGFKVAEFDLENRGPGDFLGKRQHGLPQLKIADLSQNMDVLLKAQEAAQYAFDHKSQFTPEERHLLNQSILRMMRSVGQRLN